MCLAQFSYLHPHSFTISVCLPLVATFKALRSLEKTPTSVSTVNLKPLLIYWLVLSLITVVESNLAFVLQFIPLFGLLRVYLAFWLVLPQTKGADYLYYGYIEPFIAENEHKIDKLAQCAYPRELLKVVSQYFGFEINYLSRFSTAANSASASQAPSGNSLLDQFVVSFLKSDPVKSTRSPTLVGEGGLVESLLGVVKSLPSGNAAQKSAFNSPQGFIESLSSGVTEATSGFTTSKSSNTSVSENSDFDVVGKEELINFEDHNSKAPSPRAATPQSEGWFTWSSWGSKSKSKTT